MDKDLIQKLDSLLSSHAFAGAASGFLIGILLQPLEIIKVCLIVNPTNVAVLHTANFAESFIVSTRVIYQNAGFLGFWRGLTPALLRIGVGNSVYFHFLDIFNGYASNISRKQRINDFFSSSSARVFSTLVINPLTIVKTRMELLGDQFNYRSTGDAVLKIYAKEGPSAFFKGAGACMLRDVPFAGLYYSILNVGKENFSRFGIQSSTNTMISGMFAGLVATTMTHPFDVIRTHLQINNNDNKGVKTIKEGMFKSLYSICKTDGMLGLFRGLQARLMRKPLSNALTFTFFELFQPGKQEKKVL